jgi:hypothetical protein
VRIPFREHAVLIAEARVGVGGIYQDGRDERAENVVELIRVLAVDGIEIAVSMAL